MEEKSGKLEEKMEDFSWRKDKMKATEVPLSAEDLAGT